jgi:glutaredoxin
LIIPILKISTKAIGKKSLWLWLFMTFFGLSTLGILNSCQSRPKTQPHIVIYTKVGCPRCAKAVSILQSVQLTFEEKSISQKEWGTEMWKALKKGGHQSGESITMPVVLVDSVLYYNLPEIDNFFVSMKR